MERADYRPFETLIEMSPLARLGLLARAAFRSRRR
jgi:hypothetical protein